MLALNLGLAPYTAPNFYLLTVNRICVSISAHFLIVHPLVPDYIKPESRGKATGLMSFGALIGETISAVGLIQITRDWDLKYGFALVEVIVLLFAVLTFSLIREPASDDVQEEDRLVTEER